MALMTSFMRHIRQTRRATLATGWRKRARLVLVALISLQFQAGLGLAQQTSAQKSRSSAKPATADQQTPRAASGPAQLPASKDQISKLSDSEKSLERARELFADAANAQNNGAHDIAIENWEKLLSAYPNDPLASSAHHFLGVCHLQKAKPDFSSAIEQFKLALADTQLKQREESMINLGWSLYQRHFQNQARSAASDSKVDNTDLEEAVKVLRVVVDRYPDGGFLDKALFYLAESQARLGRSDQAIDQYRLLIRNNRLATSTIRPDAVYGLGLTYEEKKQPILAIETYEDFFKEYANHPLATDVRARLADLCLAQGDTQKANASFELLLEKALKDELKNSDYILYRYGFALAKSGDFKKSAEIYNQLSKLYPDSQYSKNSSLAAGQALMREKKYDEAISAFELLLPLKDDKAAEAAHWICQIKTLQGKTSEIADIASAALTWADKTPSAPELKMALADGLSSNPSKKADAKAIYEEIATQYPEHPIASRATYNAAFNALQLGALADAQRWSEAFAKRFANDPLSSDIAFIRAESTLQLGQHESAVNAFEQLIAAHPDDPMRATWESRLVVAHYLAGQWDKAIETTNKLLDPKLAANLEPNVKAEVLFMAGASYLKNANNTKGIETKGIEFLEKSLATSTSWPQSGDVSISLAEALNNSKETDRAIQTLEELVARDPNNRLAGQAEFRIGQYAATSRNFPRAIAAYDKALATTQDSGLKEYASYGKAYALIQTEEYAKALQLLETSTQSNRNDSLGIESRIAKSICLRQLKRPDEALRVLELINSADLAVDSKQKLLYEQALSLIAVKNYDLAISKLNDLSRLTAENPGTPFPFADKTVYELAWAYKAKGDSANASKYFKQLIEKFPETSLAGEANFHIGQAEYEATNYDVAIQSYELAAKSGSDAKIKEQSLYKIGWSNFQKGEYVTAAEKFANQIREFPKGTLLIDGKFMIAECHLKTEKYNEAFNEYASLRKTYLQSINEGIQVGDQVQALTLLHGGQSARELKKWKDAESWIGELVTKFPQSQFRPVALYELAYARQNLRKNAEAIAGYTEVAETYRNELGARSRFMIGELYFAERDFPKAVAEFQKVMFGYGATQAPAEIKNWQARSAFEAGRCSEILIAELSGDRKAKAIDTAAKFYEFVVQNHANHELAQSAKARISELRK